MPPVQVDNVRGGGFQQRQPGSEIVRCGPRRQGGTLVDLAVGEPADTDIDHDVRRGIEDVGAAFGIWRHQGRKRSRQNIVSSAT